MKINKEMVKWQTKKRALNALHAHIIIIITIVVVTTRAIVELTQNRERE